MTKSRSKKAKPAPTVAPPPVGIFTFMPTEDITAHELALVIRCILLKGTITVPTEQRAEWPWTAIERHFAPFVTN